MFCKTISKTPISSASGDSYHAEYDIGLVAGTYDNTICSDNVTKLNAALAAMHASGSFTFVDGSVGPVLKPISFSAKEFGFNGIIKTSKKLGGCIRGFGSRVYPALEVEYSNGASMGGASTRLTRINASVDEPVIRIRGVGFTMSGFEIRGARWNGSAYTRSKACIQVEGRDDPASGKHTLYDMHFLYAEAGIHTVPGYYDDDDEDFNPLASGAGVHADESIVMNCHSSACDNFFLCENEQSVGFSFNHVSTLGNLNSPTVMFNYVRGGKLLAKNVQLLNGASTLIKYGGPSYNSNWMQVDDFMYDNVNHSGNRTPTGASGTGLVATLTHANDVNGPYTVGQKITVTGMNPAGYNGTHVVIASTETSVSFASTETGSFVSAGAISGGVGQYCTLFDYTHEDPNGIYYPVDVRISGHLSAEPNYWDQRKLIQFHSALGSTSSIPHFERILLDITGLAQSDGSQQMWRRRGHWLYPDKDYFAPYMAKDTDQLTISGGAITVTPELVHLVDTESAASTDDLDFIAGGMRGQEIVIRPKHTNRSIVVKKATPNVTDLIAYCKLDEPGSHGTVKYDSHGSTNFTMVGTHGIVKGVQGNATTFLDVSTNYAVASDAAAIRVGDIDATWRVRVKFDSLPAHAVSLFGKFGGSTIEYQLSWTNTTNRIVFQASGTGAYTAGGDDLRAITGSTFGGLAINTWYDIVCGHDASTNKLFLTINGVAETDADHGTIGVYSGTNSLFLVDGYWGGAAFPGCMEDFTFWKRRLSTDEIADLYNSGGVRQQYPFYSITPGRKGNILIASDTTLADLNEAGRIVCDGINWLIPSTANALTLAGTTPTAAGLNLLDDANSSAQRTTLGLGTIATQAASAVAITGGTVSGLTSLSLTSGIQGGSVKALVDSVATGFVRISCANDVAVSGAVHYAIYAKDADDELQIRSGSIHFAIVNKVGGGGLTCALGTVINETVTTSLGTLTVSFDYDLTPSTAVDIRANAVSSLTTISLDIRYQVDIFGPTALVTAL